MGAARNYKSPSAMDRVYRIVAGGHLIHLLPEELTVVTDPMHFCCDHADPSRTSRDDPDLQDFYRFCKEYGVPREVTGWQEDPATCEGPFRTLVVDGRREVAVVKWINEELIAAGETPIRLAVRVRNDLNETQIRELIARLNEGGKPPSLAMRIGQAQGFERQYVREIRAKNARAPIDDDALARRIAANFAHIGGETVKRWLRVPRLAVEAKVVIESGRGPLELVDEFAKLSLDQQREACESLGEISEPKAVKAAIQRFVERVKPSKKLDSGDSTVPTEPKKRLRKQSDWDALISKMEAHKGLAGVQVFLQVSRWQRAEIEDSELLAGLGVSLQEEPKPTTVAVDTTTKVGRDAFHRSVFDMLAANPDRWFSSSDIVAVCGGTRDQMHTALKALHKRGLVDKHGNAVHMKYQVMPDVLWPEEAPTEGKAANTAPLPSESSLDLRTNAGRAALEKRILAALARGPQCTLADLIASTKACEAGVRAGIKRLKDAVASTGSGRSKRFMLAKPDEPEEVRQTVLPVSVENGQNGEEEEDEDAGDESDDGETEEGEDAGDVGDEDSSDDQAYDDRTLDMFSDGTAEDVC